MNTTYCITGVSGYIGRLLARRLAADPKNRIVGLDLNEPEDLGEIEFHRSDIRDPAIGSILKAEKVDVVIHLAFYTLPEGNVVEAESINIDGTKNILRALREAGAKRLVLASSSAAYGSHPDNPVPMSESQPLRPNRFFYYSWHKATQEQLTQDFVSSHPGIKAVILRPCILIGPHINNPTGDSLKQKILVYLSGQQAPIQLIYEDDAVEAFRLAAISDSEGIYNIAPDKTVTYPELAKMMNKKLILLPFWLLSRLATLGKWLGVSPVSGTTLKFIRNPIVVDPSKFNRQFDFTPKYDTKQAFVQFVQQI